MGYVEEDAVDNEDPREDEDGPASNDEAERGERMPAEVHVQVAWDVLQVEMRDGHVGDERDEGANTEVEADSHKQMRVLGRDHKEQEVEAWDVHV